YGPGTDFPRIGSITKGTQYPILRRHTQFPWYEIAFDNTPIGRGWVFKDTVKVTGSLSEVPTTSANRFDYPTLTPTPEMIVVSAPVWAEAPVAPLNLTLDQLSKDLFSQLLKNNYVPNSPMQGSVFLLDLRTHQSFTLNPNVAYSGMSLAKIPVLVALFRKL